MGWAELISHRGCGAVRCGAVAQQSRGERLMPMLDVEVTEVEPVLDSIFQVNIRYAYPYQIRTVYAYRILQASSR